MGAIMINLNVYKVIVKYEVLDQPTWINRGIFIINALTVSDAVQIVIDKFYNDEYDRKHYSWTDISVTQLDRDKYEGKVLYSKYYPNQPT